MSEPSPLPHDSAPRLHVNDTLSTGATIAATDAQSHYLLHVMRRAPGSVVALFNGQDGEWSATIELRSKKQLQFAVTVQRRPQDATPDVWLMFAPLKAARLEMVVEKATELGVAALMPVITQRTVVHRVNVPRLEAIATEAAEQCERLTLPTIAAPQSLEAVMAGWTSGANKDRRLFFLDEGAAREKIPKPLSIAMSDHGASGPAAILVGPEGGFTPDEQAMVRGLPAIIPVTLGPRLLRAETAALAALSCWQALLGDWRSPPSRSGG